MKWLRRILTGLYIAFVAGALAFGAAQALDSGAKLSCTNPGSIGACPPFTNATCAAACEDEFGTTGGCLFNDDPPPERCCVCAI